MPLPTPTTDESESKFIDRCMGDDTAVDEYPDEGQRRAVCETQWEQGMSDKGHQPKGGKDSPKTPPGNPANQGSSGRRDNVLTLPKREAKTNINFKAAKHGAEIILYGDIGFDVTARDFSDELKALGDVKAIDLRINSFGGDVFDGVAIYSRLKESGADITVHIDGIAASAASVIAMAGKTIRIAEAGFVMVHDAWSMAVGNAADMRKTADRLEAVSAQIAGIYQRRTGQDMEQVRQWMAEETEFNAEESVEFGFATEVFEAERMAAKFDPERHHFKKTPTPLLPENRGKAERMVAQMRMEALGR